MIIHTVQNKLVKVGVTENCGHLFPVQFFIDEKIIEPLSVAPWSNEELDQAIPPMLKMLRGDFFCMPFGNSDVLKDENRAHGTTANDKWDLIFKDESNIHLKLNKPVSGAIVTKKVNLQKDSPVIYQEHIIQGGEGNIPLGHHLMLKVPEKVYLNFSEFLFGETPPFPVENDPKSGYSILKYPQYFNSLNEIKTHNGHSIDLSRYPIYRDHEDLVLLKSNEQLPYAWSTASAPRHGWLWFSIKNPKMLNSTILWLSDGGRKYPPFSGRHRKVIGIEEVRSYFHLGHKASIENNHFSEKGIDTSLQLFPDQTFSVRYAFGLISIPREFTYVKNVDSSNDEIIFTDISGIKVKTKFDMNFITDNMES